MKLVENWKECLRWLSVQVSLLGGTVTTVWAFVLTEEQRSAIVGLVLDVTGIGAEKQTALAVLGLFVALIVARLKAQPDLPSNQPIKEK